MSVESLPQRVQPRDNTEGEYHGAGPEVIAEARKADVGDAVARAAAGA